MGDLALSYLIAICIGSNEYALLSFSPFPLSLDLVGVPDGVLDELIVEAGSVEMARKADSLRRLAAFLSTPLTSSTVCWLRFSSTTAGVYRYKLDVRFQKCLVSVLATHQPWVLARFPLTKHSGWRIHRVITEDSLVSSGNEPEAAAVRRRNRRSFELKASSVELNVEWRFVFGLLAKEREGEVERLGQRCDNLPVVLKCGIDVGCAESQSYLTRSYSQSDSMVDRG